MKKKKVRRYRPIIKLSLSLIYIAVMCILVYSAYRLHENEKRIVHWDSITTTEEYAYLEISEMSESFAKVGNNTIHFVAETTEEEQWRISLIAIREQDYKVYKNLIDYSYGRIEEKPNSITIYGYAREITPELKELAIKNIEHFLPFERRIELNEDNFQDFLSNVYLDTTIEQADDINPRITILTFMTIVLFILLIFTIFDKDKLVDEVDNLIDINKK